MKCRLKVILVERGIKQREFAKQLGLDETYFSRIVNGKSVPALDLAQKIAQALDLCIEEIWLSE